MQHPEEGLIHAWIDGALSADENAELEAHVAQCSECAAAVAEARGLVAASSRIIGHLDHVPRNVIPATRSKKLWLRSAWPGAIAATLLVGVGFYATRDKAEPVLPTPTSAVIAPTATDSVPVMPPLAQPQQVATRPTQRRSPQPEVRAMAPANEPAISDLQKASAASVAPPPPAAPVVGSVGGSARSAAGGIQSRALSEVVVTGTADSAMRAAADRNELRAQRARAIEPSAARAQMERRDLAESRANLSFAAFVGCYEMSVSTDILPSRFALVADSSTVLPGLLGVRYLDSQGNLSDRIVDAGWTVEDNRAMIRSPGRGTIMTLTKTGDVVVASSPNGLRSGRVALCR